MKNLIRFVAVISILAGVYFFTPVGELINDVICPVADSTAVDSSSVTVQADTTVTVLTPDTIKADTVK